MDGLEGVFAAIDMAQRRKAQAQRPAPQPPPAAPQAQQPAPPRPTPPSPPPQPQPAPQAAPAPVHRAAAGPLQAMFEDGNSLLKAIVASEILGPPAALRERHLWNQSPNEPST